MTTLPTDAIQRLFEEHHQAWTRVNRNDPTNTVHFNNVRIEANDQLDVLVADRDKAWELLTELARTSGELFEFGRIRLFAGFEKDAFPLALKAFYDAIFEREPPR